MSNKTCRDVAESGLCTGCGTCFSMCPKSAITMGIDKRKGIYLPEFDERKCTHCGICYEVCPGRLIGFGQIDCEAPVNQRESNLIGKYLNCYIGHSTNPDIRYNSSSGGLVTQILAFALENGMIDGAIVTRMKRDKPLEAEPFLARTKEEIYSASKSKYCPVPANVALRDIAEQKGRFAVVGLPCHILGIRKAEIQSKELREKIVLHLGLFCSHTVNFLGTKILLERFGINEEDVRQLDYRGMGWPGSLSVLLSNSHKEVFIYRQYWTLFSSYFFTPLSCMCCDDQINEMVDLSFGDAWLRDVKKKDKLGSSIVISRSEIGEKLLREAASMGVITLDRISYDRVVASQRSPLYFKKFGRGARITILKRLGVKAPNQSWTRQTANPLLYVVGLLQLSDAILSQRKSIHTVLKYVPSICLRGWSAFLYYLERVIYYSSAKKGEK